MMRKANAFGLEAIAAQENENLNHILSVSTVVFEGHSLETAFAEIAALGLNHVEPAFIRGYMDFTEEDLGEQAAKTMHGMIKAAGLSAAAISAHMDLGHPDSTEMLARRIRFVAGIGARFCITNSSPRETESQFRRATEQNLPLAAQLGVTIALENPGHGTSYTVRDGASGARLVAEYASPHLKLNYDGCNALTNSEGSVKPHLDLDDALPASVHMHLKDVIRTGSTWTYTAIGLGEIDSAAFIAKLKPYPQMPICLELPLRLQRDMHKDPVREKPVLALDAIRTAIIQSRDFVRASLA
jgi:sugar phosphate isomerase/epimerase